MRSSVVTGPALAEPPAAIRAKTDTISIRFMISSPPVSRRKPCAASCAGRGRRQLTAGKGPGKIEIDSHLGNEDRTDGGADLRAPKILRKNDARVEQCPATAGFDCSARFICPP